MELADRSTVCGKVVRGGCLFTWNFSVASSTVLVEVERRHYTKHDVALLTCLQPAV